MTFELNLGDCHIKPSISLKFMFLIKPDLMVSKALYKEYELKNMGRTTVHSINLFVHIIIKHSWHVIFFFFF